MSRATRSIPPERCDAQAVSNILNAFSRLNIQVPPQPWPMDEASRVQGM